MKVLHITKADNGGAGLCCLRIHQSLLEQGIESKVVVFNKTTNTPEVYQYGSHFSVFLDKVISKVLDTIGIYLKDRSKIKLLMREKSGVYSPPKSSIDLTKCEYVEWADLIHLHWVNWYLDYPSFFEKIKKPIVWTLHDENLFYGAAHYKRDVLIDNRVENEYLQLKQKVLGPLTNINIVFLSEYMHNIFKNNPIISNKFQVVINNAVNTSKFNSYNKLEMRQYYNIPQDKVVFAFLAYEIFDPRKGLLVLHEALQHISQNNNIIILAIGGNESNEEVPEIIKAVGRVNDTQELSRLLSCADYFALPSFQEAFAQSPLEAMACGLPVIAFPCSGTNELINDNNGIICGDFTCESLEKGLRQLMSRQYDSQYIRNYVISRFSPTVIAKQYISLYHQISLK